MARTVHLVSHAVTRDPFADSTPRGNGFGPVLFQRAMKMSQRRPLALCGAALSLASLSGLALLAAGCSKSEAATMRRASSETTSVGAAAKAETENYVAEITASGSYKAGAEGTVEVVLVPKAGYHTNAQYPYKFKLSDPPDGVSFPKPILSRADGNFEEKRGSFKVPFVAAKAGKATINGTLSLSVCSEANCIMDTVPLEVAVEVK
jgi:hypothetical protein